MAYDKKLFYLIQIAGGTFPSGGFTQSCGLETYVTKGKVHDEKTFMDFLRTYLHTAIACCEGPILCKAYKLAAGNDGDKDNMDKIRELEEFSCAVKVTKESRESSIRTGKAFLRIMADITEDPIINKTRDEYRSIGMSSPVAYGIICSRLSISMEEAVQSYIFNTANVLAQSAVKLIPLGNTQAQKVLLDIQPEMQAAAEESMRRPVEKTINFAPGFDIASIEHESLPVRLYMS